MVEGGGRCPRRVINVSHGFWGKLTRPESQAMLGQASQAKEVVSMAMRDVCQSIGPCCKVEEEVGEQGNKVARHIQNAGRHSH